MEGLTRVENVHPKEKIIFWDGIIQTSQSGCKLCVKYALVYGNGHRTKEYASRY